VRARLGLEIRLLRLFVSSHARAPPMSAPLRSTPLTRESVLNQRISTPHKVNEKASKCVRLIYAH
jgi:hypothetical protein